MVFDNSINVRIIFVSGRDYNDHDRIHIIDFAQVKKRCPFIVSIALGVSNVTNLPSLPPTVKSLQLRGLKMKKDQINELKGLIQQLNVLTLHMDKESKGKISVGTCQTMWTPAMTSFHIEPVMCASEEDHKISLELVNVMASSAFKCQHAFACLHNASP